MTNMTGYDEAMRMLQELPAKDFPKAVEVTLNKTAGQVRTRIYDEMRIVFDRPTPWTMNSLFINSAKKDNLTASVRMKDEYTTGFSGGTPATKYLWPQVHGGPRGYKRSEASLRRTGVIGGDKFLTPGKHAKLDKYGNQTSGQLVTVLSAFGSLPGAFPGQPVYGEKKDGWAYWIDKNRKSIFRTRNNRVEVINYIVDQPQYSKRLPFYEVGREEADFKLVENAKTAIQYALDRHR